MDRQACQHNLEVVNVASTRAANFFPEGLSLVEPTDLE